MTRRLLVLLAAALCWAGTPVQSAVPEDLVRAAIVRAVQGKLGGAADVRVDALQVRGDVSQPFVAQIMPGARTGVRLRFTLVAAGAEGTRVGDAEAIVFASTRHLRAARAIHRGAPVGNAEVVEQMGDVGSVAIQTLPERDTLGSAVAAREIAQGEVLTPLMLNVPPVVKAGDRIVVRALIGAVSVQGMCVAAQAGGLGGVIRCVNPDTRKAMSARIVAPGVAEVFHAF